MPASSEEMDSPGVDANEADVVAMETAADEEEAEEGAATSSVGVSRSGWTSCRMGGGRCSGEPGEPTPGYLSQLAMHDHRHHYT